MWLVRRPNCGWCIKKRYTFYDPGEDTEWWYGYQRCKFGPGVLVNVWELTHARTTRPNKLVRILYRVFRGVRWQSVPTKGFDYIGALTR